MDDNKYHRGEKKQKGELNSKWTYSAIVNVVTAITS